jgi:hypothetical protein
MLIGYVRVRGPAYAVPSKRKERFLPGAFHPCIKFGFQTQGFKVNEYEVSNVEIAVKAPGPGRTFIKSRLWMILGRTLLLMIDTTQGDDCALSSPCAILLVFGVRLMSVNC